MAYGQNGDILVSVTDLLDDDVPFDDQLPDGVVTEAWMDGSQTRESGQAPGRFKNPSYELGPGVSSTVLVLVAKVEQGPTGCSAPVGIGLLGHGR